MDPIPDQGGRRGVVGICPRQDGRMLVIRRGPEVLAPGTFCFPGGGIEPGETEQQALVREIEEEVGLRVRPIEQLWHCRTDWNVQLAWWLAELPDAEPHIADPREVASIHWMTPAEMADQADLLASNREFLDRILDGRIRVTG
jgi:mutator protein MutT